CEMAVEGWSRDQARAWLEQAGTDPNYQGLFADVEQFKSPTRAELGKLGPSDLPEQAKVPDLVATMVAVDGHWDHLKAARKAALRPPPEPPDTDPPHEALMLAEQFREAARGDTQSRGESFASMMAEAARLASALELALREPAAPQGASAGAAAERAFV